MDPFVLNQLGLTPTGTVQVNTPTTGAQPAMVDQYDVSLVIVAIQGHAPLIHVTIPVTSLICLLSKDFTP